MAEIKWSDEQLLAIDEKDKTILVNAGAGSGKTAVLTERLLRKVKAGTHLKNLIVLTFTKLAASEMKERLRKVLIEASENDEKIKEELDYIDQANIQTIDAFTSELVKKYHYLLDIPANINIIDEATFKMEKIKIVDQIFDEMYHNNDPLFIELLDNFSVVDDESIKNNIINLYNKIVDESDLDFLDNYDSLYQKDYLNNIREEYKDLIKDQIAVITQLYNELSKHTSDSVVAKHYQEFGKWIGSINEITNYDDYKTILVRRFGKPDKKKVNNLEELDEYNKLYDQIKKETDSAKKLAELDISDELNTLHNSTYNNVKTICTIIKELHKRLEEYKKINNAYGFNDVALMAIKLLEENESVRLTMKESTVEILLDEYQDTSDIQERLINLIENNNVYMVGDVKQSIYRFRHANPDLFINKFNTLSRQDVNGMVINLNQNFRSRKEVLDAVNGIFEKVMSEKVGGVNYNGSQTLKYGLKAYDNNIDLNCNYNMKYLSYFDDEEDLLKEFSTPEIEATIIAQDVKRRAGKQQVYDKDDKALRLSKYSDYAILISSKEHFELYKKIFEYNGIPLQIHKDESFATNDEVFAINNILKVIYSFIDFDFRKEYFNLSLIGMLRSFVFDVSDYEISKLFIDKKNIMKVLKEEFKPIYDNLAYIAYNLKSMSLSQMIDEVFKRFKVYQRMMSLNDVSSVEIRLNYFKSIMSNFEALNYSINDVINYFNMLIEKDSSFEIKLKQPASDINAVKIMSIHASKGLEFPVCYFPELSKNFNFTDSYANFNYNKKYKLIIPYAIDGMIKSNIIKTLIMENEKLNEISERLRLLYVALTRPREELILVGQPLTNENGNVAFVRDALKKRFKSFYSVFNSISDYFIPFTEYINIRKLGLSKDYLYNKNTKKLEVDNKNKLAFNDIQLKKNQIFTHHPSKDSIKVATKKELEIMEEGTYFHKLLEITDFNSPDYTNYPLEGENLIRKFLESDFIKSLNIIEVYHELEYIKGEERGIIDLVIETDTRLLVIDYKLSNINDKAYIKQVSSYKDYLKSVSEKEVLGYLYSIKQGIFKEV